MSADLTDHVLDVIAELRANGVDATASAVAAESGLPLSTVNARLGELRRAGRIHVLKGYALPVAPVAMNTAAHLRHVEREITDALDGNLPRFRLELRLRQLLPRLREAIDETA